MSVEIVVPALGESVNEATVARWAKSAGESVVADEVLVELETDKVTLEVNAPATGVLSEVAAEEGAQVKPGDVLGFVEEGAVQSADTGTSSPESAFESTASSAEAGAEAEPPVKADDAQDGGEDTVEEEGSVAVDGSVGSEVQKAQASEAVEATVRSLSGEVQEEHVVRTVREERVMLDPVRRRVIDQMMGAQCTVVPQTVFAEADLGHLLDLREVYGHPFEMRHGVSLGLMGFFAKAVVAGLQEFPSLNAELDGGDIVYKHFYDLAVTLALPQAIAMPVIRDVDKISMAEFEKQLSDCAVRAEYGQLTLDDLAGSTFSISNSGGLGALFSTPALAPRQSGALALHEVQDRPVVIDGEVEVRPMMYLALSFDRRLVDEREAILFLARVKACVEDPQRLLIDV